MLTGEEAEAVAVVFNNQIRRKIVKLLLESDEPLYHNEVHSVLGGSKSTIHRNLAELTLNCVLLCARGRVKSSSSKVLVDYYTINPKFVPLLEKFEAVL